MTELRFLSPTTLRIYTNRLNRNKELTVLRRRFLLLAALAPAMLTALPVGAAPEAPAAKGYYRFNTNVGRWEPVEKRNVRAGDAVWINGEADDPENSPWHVYLCCEDARTTEAGTWFACSHRMNKAGEWEAYPPLEANGLSA